jgi:hypothetical protein
MMSICGGVTTGAKTTALSVALRAKALADSGTLPTAIGAPRHRRVGLDAALRGARLAIDGATLLNMAILNAAHCTTSYLLRDTYWSIEYISLP